MEVKFRTKMRAEEFWDKIRRLMSFLGGYYVATVGGAKIYRVSKEGYEAEMSIFLESASEECTILLEIKGDAGIAKEFYSELLKHEIITEKSEQEKIVNAFKEIRRKDLETKDLPMPYILPGFYRYYGNLLPPLLNLKINNLENRERIFRLECEVPGYTEKFVSTFNMVAKEEKDIDITPPLKPSVNEITEMQNCSLRYAIYEEDKCLEEQTYQINIYSPLDFMLAINYGDREISFANLLAAWVTPHSPIIDDVIKTASQIKKELVGDGAMGVCDSDENVWTQMKAVYLALKKMNLEYINTPVSFAPGLAQRIRYPSNVIKSGGGNCIELTIVLASAMEFIDMEPLIILLPGHAFFGLKLPSGDNLYLESTMLSTNEFEEALSVGEEEFIECQKRNAIIDIIDVKAMRSEGILPNEVADK